MIPFNLGKAVLQKDDANNIALAPGDVVTVYSQKDVRVPVARQTRLVSLEGEVNAPGIYQLQPGETLRSLVPGRRLHAAGLRLRARLQPRGDAPRQRENLQTAITRLKRCRRCRPRAMRRTGATTPPPRPRPRVSNAATQAQLSRLRASSPTAGSRSS